MLVVLFTGCNKKAEPDKNAQMKVSVEDEQLMDEPNETGVIIKKPELNEYSELIDMPSFSCDSGFYKDEFFLELNTKEKNAEIRYTLDGSVPNMNSELYTEKIHIYNRSGESDYLSFFENIGPEDTVYIPKDKINKGIVVRAAVFSDGVSGPVVTNTYFTGFDQNEDYNSLPVVSLSTDPYNLFDYEEGIYVAGKVYDEWKTTDEAKDAEYWEYKGNYTQKGREWERPVHMELIEPDGSVFETDLGMRIMGKASRTYNQKSFRMYAREEYGDKKIDYSLIPGTVTEADSSKPLEKYKTFLLRNGGNDCDYTKLKDPFIQKIVQSKAVATQESRPVIVFINGEYWGVYAIEEDYSDKFIQYNYNVASKDTVIIKTGKVDDGTEEDLVLFEDFKTLIESDLSEISNYEKLCESIDIQNFADYYSILIYTANEDCIFTNNANWRIWRTRTVTDEAYNDGKWRFLLYDTEFSLGLYKNGSTSNFNSFKKACESSWFGSLMKNEEFRALFVESLRDTAERFKPEKSIAVLDELSAVYGPVMPECYFKFGPEWVAGNAHRNSLVEYYDYNIEIIRKFLTKRYEYTETMIDEVMSNY